MRTQSAGGAALSLRCPSCGSDLGDMPEAVPGSVRCDACGFAMTSDGEFWDACADRSFPRDFARQWALWEQGRLGNPEQVYGQDPRAYFQELLAHTSLQPEQLAQMRVLEVGFGHGRLLRQIQECSATAYGIDLATPLPSARLRPGSAIFGSLLAIPFVPDQFDLVVCRGVIHHTPDPEASFGCVAEQVADGGILYLAGCYEPGARGMLVLRRVLPWSWRYPEPVLLGLASVFGALRSVMEVVRERRVGPAAIRRHYAHYKLDVFDVMTPRWSGTLDADTVLPWFAARGFHARKVGYGAYVGIKGGTEGRA